MYLVYKQSFDIIDNLEIMIIKEPKASAHTICTS